METMHFYTTGEAYTNLMYDFFTSGEFHPFEQLVEQLPNDMRKRAFLLQMKLEGTTQNGEDLSCSFLDKSPVNYGETLYFAIHTACRGKLEEFVDLKWVLGTLKGKSAKNIKTLLKYFTIDEIFVICKNQILKSAGFVISDTISVENEMNLNGVVLKDGTFIECGYQEHGSLYRLLNGLKLANSSQWTDCTDVIHVSSGSISGPASHQLEYYRLDRNCDYVSEEQIATLWKLKKFIHGTYGSFSRVTNIPNLLRIRSIEKNNLGGKFGNLAFLRDYYPEIKIPLFTTDLDMIKSDDIFIRTSPDRSIPGLLESKLSSRVNFVGDTIEMHQTFMKYKDIRGGKFHYFFQEFLEGSNGVCHIKFEKNLEDAKYIFSYQVAKNQGDVVMGKLQSEKLTVSQEKQLKEIGVKLFNDLKQSIQLEFVVHNNEIYIVQLRILEHEFERGLGSLKPDNYEYEGQTFCKGFIENLNFEDILIVSEDAKSEELLGKKALIVESNVEFSHILALSKALLIPSMFGTGKVNLDATKKIKFSAQTKESYISYMS